MIVRHLMLVGVQAGPTILFAIILWLSSARRDVVPVWLAIALGLVLLQDLVCTGLWGWVPQPYAWGRWNWTGAALALGFGVSVATLRSFGLRETGLRLQQAAGSVWAWLAALIGCFGLIAILLTTGGNGFQGWDTLVFEATLVPTQEEIFYRGILLYALDRAFLERRRLFDTDIGPGLFLTALYFASVYGLQRGTGWGFEFRPPLFAALFATGLFLGWLRRRTGSLLAPIFTRAVGNAILATF